MAIDPFPPGMPLNVGRLIGDTYKVYMANFLPFSLIVALATIPLVVWPIVAPAVGADGENLLLVGLVHFGLYVSLTYFAQGVVVFGSVEYMAGRSAPLGTAVRRGVSTAFPVFGVALLLMVAIAGSALLAALPFGIFIFLYVAIRLVVTYWVAVPAAVIERPGVMAALRRSGELTSGHRPAIFAALLVFGAMAFVGGLIVAAVFGESTTSDVLSSVVGVPFSALFSVSSAVAYSQLRETREGVSIDELAEIFS